VFQKAIERASPDESLQVRVLNLIDSITFSVFQYTTRGLFECDKLTYTAQVTFQVSTTRVCNPYTVIYCTGKDVSIQRKPKLTQPCLQHQSSKCKGWGTDFLLFISC